VSLDEGIVGSGNVLRAVAPSKRRGWVEETFLVVLDDDEFLTARDYLGGLSKHAVACDISPFSIREPSSSAVLYVHSLGEDARVGRADGARQVSVRNASELDRREVNVTGTVPFTHQEFVDLVHRDGIALEQGEDLASQLANRADTATTARLWATVKSMTNTLARAAPPYQPGTDSFTYWALAVIFGPPSRFLETISGQAGEVSDIEMGRAERLTKVAEDIHFAQTGERVDFSAAYPRKARATASTQELAPQFVGVHFTATHGHAVAEHVGLFTSTDFDALEPDALAFASREADRAGATLIDVTWSECRNLQFYSGMTIIALNHRWAGTIGEFTHNRELTAADL